MAADRRLPLLSRVFVILDRWVAAWWLFIVCATLPVFLLLLEPMGLMQDALLSLGGPIEQGVVVQAEMTNGTINATPVWRTEVALATDSAQRQIGYSTGLVHVIGDEVTVHCALITCDIFQAEGLRSTQLGLATNLFLAAMAAFLGMFPVRTLWRRRWWWAALQRGVPTLGWVAEDSRSSEDLQRLIVHYDDAHDARWQTQGWLGYRKAGLRWEQLEVLYLEEAPQRAVVLDELQDWMGTGIPASGESWPLPDAAGWLRVGIGGGALVGTLLIYAQIMG